MNDTLSDQEGQESVYVPFSVSSLFLCIMLGTELNLAFKNAYTSVELYAQLHVFPTYFLPPNSVTC